MTIRRWVSGLAASCACAVAVVAVAESLPNDERVLTGTLKNGVTWKFRAHDNPPDKMALLVHVRTGSLNEAEAQRGLAHFIEHMCFNGTEHYPPGTLIKYFESIGMEFGADLNAYTSFDETVYMLFLPDTKTDSVDKGLMTLSDYVFRASLIGEEIDKERGVVLAEWRSGQGAQQRVQDEEFRQVYAGTRFGERLPIGLPEVIEKAPHEEFVKYYQTWYRPEHMTVIVVGDTTVDNVKPALEKWFGEHEARVPASAQQKAGFKPFAAERAFVITDPELGGSSVELTAIEPGRPPVTTVEEARVRMIENVGTWILNRRLDERVQKGEATYNRASAWIGDFFHDGVMLGAQARGEAKDWAAMLDEVVVEVVRARTHGFTERELQLARKEILADAQRAVETEPTRNARSIMFQIARAVNDLEPLLSAKQDLEITEKLLPTIKLEEVNAAFKDHFSDKNFAYIVNMPEKEGNKIPTTDEVLAAARSAMGKKPDALQESAAPTELLAELPKPGAIAESSVDEDLKIASVWLANNVRAHHRFMDYKKDTVLVSIMLAGGRIEEKSESLGLTEVVEHALRSQPATSRLTSTNVRDLMTGVNINVSAGAGEDGFFFTISGSPKDLEKGLQLAYALLTDGKIEDSAIAVWKKNDERRRAMLTAMPEFKAFEAMAEEVYGGDPRFKPMLPKERVDAITAADAQAWYDRIRASAPIEVAVVGQIEYDAAMELIRKYVGALPKRERRAESLDSLRKVSRSTGPLVRNVTVDTMTPKAMAVTGFIGCHERDVYDLRALEIASHILSSRLIESIREKMSLVYSLRAGNRPSSGYEDAGMFATMAPCDPAKVRQVIEEVQKIYTAFSADGPTEEELVNAKKQIANNLDEELREPSYWLDVLRNLDYHGLKLEDEKAEPTAYEAYTAEDVVKVFRKYRTPQRSFEVTAVPSGKDTSDPEAQKATEKSPS